MQRFKLLTLLLCLAAFTQTAHAQATLSIQGIIQKSSGAAVDDGKYDLTFKLYPTNSGGTAVHSETQSVSVAGGIYSAELGGGGTPLSAAFDQTYYLGVSVDGGAELVPRTRLTSSPYALSLLGTENLFSSSGTVGIGTVTPAAGYQLHTKKTSGIGKILLEGSDAAQLDFKKGSTVGSIGFGTANNDFVLNPGSNNTTFQYNGSTKLTVNSGGIAVNGSITGFSPAELAVTSKLAVGQASVDANYALKVVGNSSLGGLRIQGSVPGYQTCSGCTLYNSNGVVNFWGGINPQTATGIYVEGRSVDAQYYITQSDRRIKNNFVHPNALSDLILLNKLKVTDYQYIDKRRGDKTVKGFIAQEVEEVLPDAITLSTSFIPSILAAPVGLSMKGSQLQVEMEKAHDLKKGDKVRFYTPDGETDITVAEALSATIFAVDNWEKPAKSIFVYGKEISDFHGIDFDQVTALNVSATQELARKVELLEKENAALRSELGESKAENTQMKASAEKFDARLRALENRISN